MTGTRETPTEDSKHPYEASRESHPDKVAVAALIAAIALAIPAIFLVGSVRHVVAVLLILVGATLIVVLALTNVGRSKRFNTITIGILTVALIGAGCVLNFVPVQLAAAKAEETPKPALYFPEGASAPVPYCKSYAVQILGSVPAGFQVAMFDAPTDSNGNVVGDYNFDGQAKPVGNIPGKFGIPNLTIGQKSAKAGFTAVIVAAIIVNREANILEEVQAAPTGWGLKNLPFLLTSKTLQVTRNGNHAAC
jgi:hypothetical protein